MNNDDLWMLKDLPSAITALETLCDGLQHSLSDDGALSGQEDNHGLRVQWQKLLGNLSPAHTHNKASNSNEATLIDALQAQLTFLKRHQQQQQEQQQQSREQLLQAAHFLQEADYAEERLSGLITALEGNGHIIYYLYPLLECYQQAVSVCAQQRQQERARQQEICQRLLTLIDELSYTGDVGNEINSIKQLLLAQSDHTNLPAHCLRLIALVIEGSRLERQLSSRFLLRLNNNLESMQTQCLTSVSEGKRIVSARQIQDASLVEEIHAIDRHLSGHLDTSLAQSIVAHLNGLKTVAQQHAQLQQREAALLSQLESLENEVGKLKQQTSDYRRRLTSQNEKLMIDGLTQIYNRTALDERLKVDFARWQKTQSPLCIVLLDVDFFKKINDQYGHLAGDKALRLIARTLRNSLKESDFIARFGGEEFAILMLDVDPILLHRPLHQLRQKIEAIPFSFKQERVTITVSIGATLLQPGDTITTALERADQALYRAKNAGRNQLVIA
ncbi:GGDEF domain-containing protein [Oceanimonas baumannii]|uniref:diguanylate cyclase n=2 Tax=Oceanimonas baumannii TaxID=129578 RepID=A0ABY2F0E1_9GAMM|nr:GGDEF domain-containing protein [Oceanimonas baumannii]TDW60022.1 diguanylate cyclase (GGDEF)-like protein [Oceanimonas baumannii]